MRIGLFRTVGFTEPPNVIANNQVTLSKDINLIIPNAVIHIAAVNKNKGKSLPFYFIINTPSIMIEIRSNLKNVFPNRIYKREVPKRKKSSEDEN